MKAKGPRRGTQAEYDAFVRRMDARMMRLVRRLARGGDVDDFGTGMIDLLEEAHLGAAWRGRLLAGVRGRISDDERAYAEEIAGEQAEFLIEWLDHIRDGRYSREDVLSLAGMRQRGRYYLERLRGTANEMFIVASDPDEDWFWDLGPAEHCDDCLYFAANSPWKEADLETRPGECETECRSKCKCKLRRGSDDLAGFEFVDLYETQIIDIRPAIEERDRERERPAATARAK